MSKIFTISLIFLLTISIIASIYTPQTEAQTNVGSTETYQTPAIPYVNPYFFTMDNGTRQFIVSSNQTLTVIHPFDTENNPVLTNITSQFVLSPYTSESNNSYYLSSLFVSDNSLYLYQFDIWLLTTISNTHLYAHVNKYTYQWNSSSLSFIYVSNSSVLDIDIAGNNFVSELTIQQTAKTFTDTFGNPSVIYYGIYQFYESNILAYSTNEVMFYLTDSLASSSVVLLSEEGSQLSFDVKAMFVATDAILSKNWALTIYNFGATTYIDKWNFDISSGAITHDFQALYQWNYGSYFTSSYTLGSLGSVQSLLFYPAITFLNQDANTFQLIGKEWLIQTSTGNLVLTLFNIQAQRSGSTVTTQLNELLVIPSTVTPISTQIFVSAIGSIQTIRVYIWNTNAIQYATYTYDLSTNVYSFQGWTTIQTPSGWTYPSWVTRYYIWKSLTSGFVLLSYNVPFTAIGGYAPPTPISGEDGIGSFDSASSLVGAIIAPFLIIFLPPLVLAFAAGKVGFLVGLVLTISVGTTIGVVPVWMIFLVGIGLVLLLYSRFGRDSVETVGE